MKKLIEQQRKEVEINKTKSFPFLKETKPI